MGGSPDGLREIVSASRQPDGLAKLVLARAHHDLQQHLNTIQLYLGLLETKSSDPAIGELVKGIRCSSESLSQLVDSLSDLGHLELDGGHVEARRVPANTVLGSLAADAGRVRRMHSSLVARADAYYLRRVLNLLLSVVTDRSSDGRVLVGARRRGGSVLFELWASGSSVSGDELARIDAQIAAPGAPCERNDLRLVLAKSIARLTGITIFARKMTPSLTRLLVVPGPA